MKKKLITGILATLACCTYFAGCDLLAPIDNPLDNLGATSQTASLDDAKDYLKALYKDMTKECATQYSVVSNVVINGVSHSVTWTVDDAAKEVVTITAGEKETVIKINQDKLTEDVTYTLTATITAPDGSTISISFKDMKAVISVLPEEGVAYKMYISQGGLGELYYLNGEIASNRYLAMTKKVDEAKDIYTSIVDGGYKFYYSEGETKNYIYITKNSADKVAVFYTTNESEASIFNYSVGKADNSQYRCWWATFENTDYAIGSRQNYDTIAASSKYFYDNPTEAQYPAELIAADKVDTLEKPVLTRHDDPNPPAKITQFAENTPYKIYAYHAYKQYPMYLTGAKNSNANLPYYFPTAKEANGTRDFYVEATTGGYYIYNKANGVKTYINVKVDGEYTSNFYEATPTSVWTFDADLGTLVTNVNGSAFCMGSDSTHDTIQALSTDDLNTCNVAYFITPPAGTEWVDPEPIVKYPVAITEKPVDGKSYKIYMNQTNLNSELYFNGTTGNNEYWLATTTNMADAVDVLVEYETGSTDTFYLSFMNGTTKTYINIVQNGNFVNSLLQAEKSAWKWDATNKMIIATVNSTDYTLGTNNDKSYNTISAMKVSANPFKACLATLGAPTEGSTPPADNNTVTILPTSFGVAQETKLSTTPYELEGLTITATDSGNGIKYWKSDLRIYADNTLTISWSTKTVKKITITTTTGDVDDNKVMTADTATVTGATADYTATPTVVLTPNTGASSIEIKGVKQIRIYKIVVEFA